jgi:Short-chain dehydrogenases of various substrate specificities
MKYPYGKTILITGASSGIGLSCAKMFAENGFTVFACSRRAEQNIENTANGKIYGVKMDVTNEQSVLDAYNYILSKTDNIGIILHSAGIGIAGSGEDTFCEEIENLFKTNYFGVLRVNRIFMPIMRKQKNGLILAVSSVAGIISIPYQGHYSSSKFALEAYIETLRLESKQFGIKASLIEPGDTKTGFTDSRRYAMPENSPYMSTCKKSIAKMANDERFGKPPESCAEVALKLAEKKNPPVRVTVGFTYKLIVFLKRLLPAKVLEFAVSKLYT